MLDLMRKNASSWIIKLMLGSIIISFAFFFGYNRIQRSRGNLLGKNEGEAVATVNGTPISVEIFKMYLDKNLERLKDSFKGESIPDNMIEFVQKMTMQQLIQRTLLLNAAKKMGITISDIQLADAIKKDVSLMSGGKFDPEFYRERYLPYFENRYHINYEEILKEDIIINTFEKLISSGGTSLSEKSNEKEEKISWTFEVADIKPQKLVDEKVIDDAAKANEIVELFSNQPNNWKKLGKEKHVDVKTTEPLTVAERAPILNGKGSFEDFKKIFSLNEGEITSPINNGDSTFLVRLVKKNKESSADTDEPSRKYNSDFLNEWLQREAEMAKVVNYIDPKPEI